MALAPPMDVGDRALCMTTGLSARVESRVESGTCAAARAACAHAIAIASV